MNLYGINIDDSYVNEFMFFIGNNKNKYFDTKHSKAFAKSLGYKCNSEGWVTLYEKMPEDKIKELFDVAQKNGTSICFNYTLKISPDYPSEWYILQPAEIIDEDDDLIEHNRKRINGVEWNERSTKAYKIPEDKMLYDDYILLLRKPVIELLNTNNIDEMDFVWVKDTSSVKSEQFFAMYPRYSIPWCFDGMEYQIDEDDEDDDDEDDEEIRSDAFATLEEKRKALSENIAGLGNKVKTIWDNSAEATITVPYLINKELLSGHDICVAYAEADEDGEGGIFEVLVSAKVRNLLLEHSYASGEDFIPLLLTEEEHTSVPKGLFYHELAQLTVNNTILEYYNTAYEKYCQGEKTEKKSKKSIFRKLFKG